jgi:hypothetical protein
LFPTAKTEILFLQQLELICLPGKVHFSERSSIPQEATFPVTENFEEEIIPPQ